MLRREHGHSTAWRPHALRAPLSLMALVALLSASWGAGCGAATTTAVRDDGRRHPDGVAVDPLELPPDPVDRAMTHEGVVALRTPLGVETARETAAQFLQAISREDNEALRRVMSSDAIHINPATRVRENAHYFHSRRFSKLDYYQLSLVSFFQDDRMELYRASEAESMWADIVGATANPSPGAPSIANDALESGDVVVRVPISTSRFGATQLLGEEVMLLMRRSGGRFVVHRIVEEFQLN